MARGDGRGLRLLAEFGVIVVGVLVALVAESWWQGRQEAAQERENLEVLAGDLLSADTILTRVIREDSVAAAALQEDLVAIAARDTTHTLRLVLTVSDYRLRTGGLARVLSDPGPVLESSPRLYSLLSDLQAEVRLVDGLNRTMTAELFGYVEGALEARADVERETGRRGGAAFLAGLADRPAGVASVTMVAVLLQNRDNIHRRLQALVRDAREGLPAWARSRVEADASLESLGPSAAPADTGGDPGPPPGDGG